MLSVNVDCWVISSDIKKSIPLAEKKECYRDKM